MPVDVKTAPRRELHFETLDDIVADAEAVTAGPHRSAGNWTAAQNIWHVAMGVGMLSKGIDLKIPLPMKVFGRGLKLFGLHISPYKPGIKPPAKIAEAFAPPADATLDKALQKLRDEVDHAKTNGMPHPSPLFGKLSPDEAVKFQCRHAELHLGFIHPGRDDPSA